MVLKRIPLAFAAAALGLALTVAPGAQAGKSKPELSADTAVRGGPGTLKGKWEAFQIWEDLQSARSACLTVLNAGKSPVVARLGPLLTGVALAVPPGESAASCTDVVDEIWIEACSKNCSLAWRVDRF